MAREFGSDYYKGAAEAAKVEAKRAMDTASALDARAGQLALAASRIAVLEQQVADLLVAITEGYGGMYDDVPGALDSIADDLAAIGADSSREILHLISGRLREAVAKATGEVSP